MITRLKISLAIAVMAICFCIATNAQQQGFSTQVLYFQDTSYVGGNDSAVVRIKNLDTSSYSGYINIYYSTDTVAFSSVSFCTINNLIMNGLDSVQSTCPITFDSTYFHPGDNIVVVWSSGNAKMPADTAWKNIYLNSSGAGINEKDLSSSFRVYPTAANDYIFIESLEKNSIPKKIFIEDVSGRIIAAVSPSLDSKNRIKINTAELNSGIYFLDILLPDKQRIISKFVKAE